MKTTTRSLFFLLASTFAGLSVACGGSSSGSNTTCGAGTALQNGQCVSVAQGGGGMGGSPVAAGGGTSLGGAAITGGASASGGGAGATGVGGSVAGGGGGGSGAPDEACPAAIGINCGTCPGQKADPAQCTQGVCKGLIGLTITPNKTFVIRTPSHPASLTCSDAIMCGGSGGWIMAVFFATGGQSGLPVRVRSDNAAWRVSLVVPPSQCTPPTQSCTTGDSSNSLLVQAVAPDAPSANIYIDVAPFTCP